MTIDDCYYMIKTEYPDTVPYYHKETLSNTRTEAWQKFFKHSAPYLSCEVHNLADCFRASERFVRAVKVEIREL